MRVCSTKVKLRGGLALLAGNFSFQHTVTNEGFLNTFSNSIITNI